MDDTMRKYWKVGAAIVVVAIAVVVGLAYCSRPAGAAEPAKEQTDPWNNLCLPITLGYMDDGDLPYGSGLGYTFEKSRITLMAQIVRMELDGDLLNVPTGTFPPLVQYATPKQDKTAYLLTVVIPLGRR